MSDEDKVWVEVRHMHMKDALDKLIADFKAYAGEHGGTFGGASVFLFPSAPSLRLIPRTDRTSLDLLQRNEYQRHEGHARELASDARGQGKGEADDVCLFRSAMNLTLYPLLDRIPCPALAPHLP